MSSGARKLSDKLGHLRPAIQRALVMFVQGFLRVGPRLARTSIRDLKAAIVAGGQFDPVTLAFLIIEVRNEVVR
jgi:hypothetical protein